MSNNTTGFEILVVDDDKVVGLLHKNLLRHSGINPPPVLCYNGLEALEYIKQNDTVLKQFLIFLDLNMPVLNGWKFLKKLKNEVLMSRIHVVIVTSSINKKDYLKAQKYGNVLQFCPKPMTLDCVEKITNLEPLLPFFSGTTEQRE